MILQLAVRKKPAAGILYLGFAPLGRIVFGLIALFLLGGLLLQRELAIVSLLLGLISLLAAVYNETWVFDTAKASFEHDKYLLVRFKRTSYPLPQLSRVLLRVVSGPGPIDKEDLMKKEQPHIPNALRKGRAVLLLELAQEGSVRRLVLDDRSHRAADSLEGLGNAIAAHCGIPFDKGRHEYV